MSNTSTALLNRWNLVFVLVGAVLGGASLATEAPAWLAAFLLLFVGGIELAYLGWSRSAGAGGDGTRSPLPPERQRPTSQGTLYRQLRRQSQRRYYRLRALRDEIRANARQFSTASQEMFANHLRKLDGLLQSYLELLHRREQYYDLATRTAAQRLRQAIQTLEAELEEASERVRSVKQRRLDVLEKRQARLQTAEENLKLIGAQLGTIEDVVKYIHEQSWALPASDEVTRQLDVLLAEVEETQRSIRDVESLLTDRPGSADEPLAELDRILDEATGAAPEQTGGETGSTRTRE